MRTRCCATVQRESVVIWVGENVDVRAREALTFTVENVMVI